MSRVVLKQLYAIHFMGTASHYTWILRKKTCASFIWFAHGNELIDLYNTLQRDLHFWFKKMENLFLESTHCPICWHKISFSIQSFENVWHTSHTWLCTYALSQWLSWMRTRVLRSKLRNLHGGVRGERMWPIAVRDIPSPYLVMMSQWSFLRCGRDPRNGWRPHTYSRPYLSSHPQRRNVSEKQKIDILNSNLPKYIWRTTRCAIRFAAYRWLTVTDIDPCRVHAADGCVRWVFFCEIHPVDSFRRRASEMRALSCGDRLEILLMLGRYPVVVFFRIRMQLEPSFDMVAST